MSCAVVLLGSVGHGEPALPMEMVHDPAVATVAAICVGLIAFAERIAQPRIEAGKGSVHRAPQRAVRGGTPVIESAAAGHRRPRTARARTETHWRQLGHPAQSAGGKSGNAAKKPSPAGLLCGRLPVVHRRELIARQRI